jgi:hypothetical protein
MQAVSTLLYSLGREDQFVRRMVRTAVNIKIIIFWDVTPYTWVARYQGLGRTWCLHLQGVSQGKKDASTLKLEATGSLKKMAPIYQFN